VKDPYEVLQKKEQELLRVRKEIEALRIAAKLLGDDTSMNDAKVDLKQLVELP